MTAPPSRPVAPIAALCFAAWRAGRWLKRRLHERIWKDEVMNHGIHRIHGMVLLRLPRWGHPSRRLPLIRLSRFPRSSATPGMASWICASRSRVTRARNTPPPSRRRTWWATRTSRCEPSASPTAPPLLRRSNSYPAHTTGYGMPPPICRTGFSAIASQWRLRRNDSYVSLLASCRTRRRVVFCRVAGGALDEKEAA